VSIAGAGEEARRRGRVELARDLALGMVAMARTELADDAGMRFVVLQFPEQARRFGARGGQCHAVQGFERFLHAAGKKFGRGHGKQTLEFHDYALMQHG
jgi:hypothetical protein